MCTFRLNKLCIKNTCFDSKRSDLFFFKKFFLALNTRDADVKESLLASPLTTSQNDHIKLKLNNRRSVVKLPRPKLHNASFKTVSRSTFVQNTALPSGQVK